jgi:hypothetical protein
LTLMDHGSEGMGINVDIDESKENMVFSDEVRTVQALDSVIPGCDDTLKAWASTMKLIQLIH